MPIGILHITMGMPKCSDQQRAFVLSKLLANPNEPCTKERRLGKLKTRQVLCVVEEEEEKDEERNSPILSDSLE